MRRATRNVTAIASPRRPNVRRPNGVGGACPRDLAKELWAIAKATTTAQLRRVSGGLRRSARAAFARARSASLGCKAGAAPPAARRSGSAPHRRSVSRWRGRRKESLGGSGSTPARSMESGAAARARACGGSSNRQVWRRPTARFPRPGSRRFGRRRRRPPRRSRRMSRAAGASGAATATTRGSPISPSRSSATVCRRLHLEDAARVSRALCRDRRDGDARGRRAARHAVSVRVEPGRQVPGLQRRVRRAVSDDRVQIRHLPDGAVMISPSDSAIRCA